MIALAFSLLIAAYLLVPYAWFRYLLGGFVSLRAFQEGKTEDLTRAVVTVALPFIFCLLVVWSVPFIKEHPLNVKGDSLTLEVDDYVTVANGLYSEELFRQDTAKFWGALRRVGKRQGRFAFWYLVSVTALARLLGKTCRSYGKLHRSKWFPKRLVDSYLLPHISQWYVLLTAFTFPDPKNTKVKADVLMSDGNLYRGTVADHYLDKDGELAGIFLAEPSRYDRRSQLREREAWGTTRPSSAYLRSIPSTRLYLVADKIMNLNLNYEPPTAHGIENIVEKFVRDRKGGPPISISVTVSPKPLPPLRARIGRVHARAD